jgi:hypothetical protein
MLFRGASQERRTASGRAAAILDDQMLHDLTTNDVFWDKIVDITSIGERETHSISVADTDNLCRWEFRCLPHRVATTRPLLQLRGATKTILFGQGLPIRSSRIGTSSFAGSASLIAWGGFLVVVKGSAVGRVRRFASALPAA